MLFIAQSGCPELGPGGAADQGSALGVDVGEHKGHPDEESTPHPYPACDDPKGQRGALVPE